MRGTEANVILVGFFALLFGFRLLDLYHAHFYADGWRVVAYQAMRIAFIPYLLWLQYWVGHRVSGRSEFIPCFFIGTAVWHGTLFALGLAELLYYPVMFMLAGGVMLASYNKLRLTLVSAHDFWKSRADTFVSHRMMTITTAFAFLAFLFLKGTYPSGGHDFFNHYFQYYLEVVESGSLGPHPTWYQYYYSKGLGLYFMSMILLDPWAIHLVGTTFVIVAAYMVFELLRSPARSLILPFFGVCVYWMLYIYTSGRGIFAANGGWGDLEKTHELTAVLLFGVVWLLIKMLHKPERHLAIALYAASVTTVIIGFVSGVVLGLFFALLFGCLLALKHSLARVVFKVGTVTAGALLSMLVINYINTGIPLDQLSHYLWGIIDWQKVLQKGYSLELYSHLYDLQNYNKNALPFWDVLPKMITTYYRLYMFWPLLVVSGCCVAIWLAVHKQRPRLTPAMYIIMLFLFSTLIFAIFMDGRSQFISFFRFSTFNYAPTLVLILMGMRGVTDRWLNRIIPAILSVAALIVVWGATMTPPDTTKLTFSTWLHFKVGEWKRLADAVVRFNTGETSLYGAIKNQQGRVGRMRWGGVHPAMPTLYESLPEGMRVWSFYNHSYCLLPTCNVQQYFSQVTSPRWYDIALGSIEEGKKIMQEEGLNLFFYSRNINTVVGSDTKDQLIAFYDGFAPDHIEKTFGILWTNGWDYLLTWKEESLRPLDHDFMASWNEYYDRSVRERVERFPVKNLAVVVKQSVQNPNVKHPPIAEWMQ